MNQQTSLQILSKITQMLGEGSVLSTAGTVVEAIGEMTGWPTIALLISDDVGGFTIQAKTGSLPEPGEIARRALATGCVQTFPESITVSPETETRQTYSAIAFPLRSGEFKLGILFLADETSERLSVSDIPLGSALAQLLALAFASARRREALNERIRAWQALQDASLMIAPDADLTTTMNQIIQRMGRAVNVTSAYLCSYDEKRLMSTVLAEYFDPEASVEERESDLGVTYSLPEDFPGDMEFLEKGIPEVDHFDDENVSTSKRDHLRKFGARSALSIPLKIMGRTVAYAELWESRRKREFSADEIALSQSMAQQAAVILENSRLLTETGRQVATQRALFEASSAFSSSLDLLTILRQVVEQLCLALNLTSAYLCDFNAETQNSTVLADFVSIYANEKERESDLGTVYHLPTDFPGAVDFLYAGDVDITHLDDSDLDDVERIHLLTYGAKTTITVPVRIDGQPVAYVELWESRQRRDFTEDEIDLCLSISQQASVAMQNANLYREVKKQNGRLRALVEATRDGIVLISLTNHVLIINQSALELFQLDGTTDRRSGQALRTLFQEIEHEHPEILSSSLPEFEKKVNGANSQKMGEIETESLMIRWFYIPVVDHEELLGYLLVMRDVSDEKLLQRLREDFTHTLVHDLRSPLTAISVGVDVLRLMEASPDDYREKRKKTMVRIKANINRLISLVDEILTTNQLENHQLVPDFHETNLFEMVEHLIESQLPVAHEKRISLHNHVSAEIPPVVLDPKLIERSIENLVGNALKFTPAGGVIRVTAQLDLETDPQLTLSVADTGIGIAPGIRKHLFDKFVTGKRVGRVGGIGLYFCKLVSEAHRGRIWVAESSEKGTIISMRIPMTVTASGLTSFP